jgi:hypothetical protein
MPKGAIRIHAQEPLQPVQVDAHGPGTLPAPPSRVVEYFLYERCATHSGPLSQVEPVVGVEPTTYR